jgi:hypothetical protein
MNTVAIPQRRDNRLGKIASFALPAAVAVLIVLQFR